MMRYTIKMQWLLVLLLLPSIAFASEDCASQFRGKCRNVCAPDETAEQGAFIDCAETQRCCVRLQTTKTSGVIIVLIGGYVFKPEMVRIKAGTEVIWKNNDDVEHTITAGDKSFDSGTLGPQKEFKIVFSKPGTYKYYCDMHPSMAGTVIVEQ